MLPPMSLLAFLKLGRPQFLIGGFALYGLGAALSTVSFGPVDWPRYAWGQAFISAVQLMTHYSNDYFDLEADRANSTPTRWSGGSRVLINGAVPPIAALIAALVLAVVALGVAFALSLRTGSPRGLLPFSLLILALSWFYSSPPLRLLSRGWGEATTAFVVTLCTPLFGFYLQQGALTRLPLLACVPLCGLQFAMLLTIELPDAAGDAALGKRTLVVRHGAERGARAAALIVGLCFLSLPLLVVLGLPGRIALAAALPAPLGAWHAWRLFRGAFRLPEAWESLAFTSVVLVLSTTCAELAGVWLL